MLLAPRKPTNDMGGHSASKIGNYHTREFEGALNAPMVTDKLLVRIAGAYHDRDGYNQPVEKVAPFGHFWLTIDWNNVFQSGADIGFYATSLTKTLYRIGNPDMFQIGSLLTRASIHEEPRMCGLHLRYRFGAR